MPRLTALRVGALSSLAAQLRFTPRDTLVRQIARIEELAAEIDPALNYPEDWVVFRITGYRPDMPDPATLVGLALLADLSALAERLSDEAALTRDDLPPGSLAIPALCARWSVTRKTLERYRRRGLIAWRVRAPRGRVSLVFTPHAINSFERTRNRGALARSAGQPPISSAANRLLEAERERIVRTARLGRRFFGWSLHEAASRISARIGRGRETVRQLLRSHDFASCAPTFTDPAPLTGKQRRVIHRAWLRGVEPSTIAARFGCARMSVHRVINERRAELLRRLALPSQDELSVDDLSAMPRTVHEGLGRPAERSLAEFLAAAASDPIPIRTIEQALASAHRSLIRSSARMIAALPRHNPRARDLDRAETNLRWATLLRAELVRSQRRLALQSIEGRIEASLDQFPADRVRALHRLAMDSIIAAVASFEPSKGGRLAAPAGLAITRALAGAADSLGPVAGARRAIRSHVDPVPLDDWTLRLTPWQPLLDPSRRLRAAIDTMPEPGRSMLAARYAWDGSAPKTLAEIAAAFSTTPQRIARLERSALRAVPRAAATR